MNKRTTLPSLPEKLRETPKVQVEEPDLNQAEQALLNQLVEKMAKRNKS